MSNRMAALGWVVLAAALALLNSSLTFDNVWPTLSIRPTDALSMEAAVCVLAIVATHRWLGAPSPVALRWLGVLWVALVLGRYADVTARSLYGRDINLYWDLRLMPGADVGHTPRPGSLRRIARLSTQGTSSGNFDDRFPPVFS